MKHITTALKRSKIAQFLADFKNITKIRILPYHNYAGSKYSALGMENTLPHIVPDAKDLEPAKAVIRKYNLKIQD